MVAAEGGALAATLCILLIGYLPRFAPDARYVQLDVGQGDAAVLRHGRQATLVDVGPAGCYDVLRYLRHEGLYVDALILSHLDEDHAGRSARCWRPKSRDRADRHAGRAHRNLTHHWRCGRRSSWQTKGAFQSKRRPPERKSFRAALCLTCSRRRRGWRATTSVRWCCIRSPWARGF
ncbi:MAG: MBL fold metallo-hydrolase [Christensenellales bacterium]